MARHGGDEEVEKCESFDGDLAREIEESPNREVGRCRQISVAVPGVLHVQETRVFQIV